MARDACDDRLQRLSIALYQSLLETPPWHSFIRAVREALDAWTAGIIFRQPCAGDPGHMINLGGPSTHWLSQYREQFFAQSLFVNLPIGVVTTTEDLTSPEELAKTEFFKRFMEPVGITFGIALEIPTRDGNSVQLSASRTAGTGPFEDADKKLLSQLCPHLEIALRLYAQSTELSSERDVYSQTIERLALGVITLNTRKEVLHVNDDARTVVDSNAPLQILNGRLRLGSAQERRRLDALVDEALIARMDNAPRVTGALRLGRDTKPAALLDVLVRPVSLDASSEADPDATPAVTLFLSPRDEALRTLDPQVLQDLFSFTPSEVVVAQHMIEGLSVDEVASTLHNSPHTIKAHLRKLLAKTGTRRQSDMVRTILTSIARLS